MPSYAEQNINQMMFVGAILIFGSIGIAVLYAIICDILSNIRGKDDKNDTTNDT